MILETDFVDHWKTQRLVYICGPDAVLCLLRIWSYCQQRKRWQFDGAQASIIEWIGKWNGEKGLLLATLKEVGFIDEEEDGEFSMHDFENVNGKMVSNWANGTNSVKKTRSATKKDSVRSSKYADSCAKKSPALNKESPANATPRGGHEQANDTPRGGHEQANDTPRIGHGEANATPRAGDEQATATPRIGHEQANGTPRIGHEQANATPRIGHGEANATPRAGDEQANATPRAGDEQATATPRGGDGEANATPRIGDEQANGTPRICDGEATATPRVGHADPTHTPRGGHADPTQTPRVGHADPTQTPRGPHADPTPPPRISQSEIEEKQEERKKESTKEKKKEEKKEEIYTPLLSPQWGKVQVEVFNAFCTVIDSDENIAEEDRLALASKFAEFISYRRKIKPFKTENSGAHHARLACACMRDGLSASDIAALMQTAMDNEWQRWNIDSEIAKLKRGIREKSNTPPPQTDLDPSTFGVPQGALNY